MPDEGKLSRRVLRGPDGRNAVRLPDPLLAILGVTGLKEILIGTYLEFVRNKIDDNKLSGFVISYNDDLTLLHHVDSDFKLHGYSIFRNSDVTSWTVFDSPDYFMNRALRLKGIRPRRPRALDISSWRLAFETASRNWPLFALHREALRNDVCWVGRYVDSTPKTVTLYEISPTAEWEKPTRFRIADITRIDFGGGYEDALWRVAEEDGPCPATGPNKRVHRSARRTL